MAKAVAEFLVVGIDNKYITPEKTHLLGWSYSGQLVGYIARYIGAKYDTKIASIVGMSLLIYVSCYNVNLPTTTT